MRRILISIASLAALAFGLGMTMGGCPRESDDGADLSSVVDGHNATSPAPNAPPAGAGNGATIPDPDGGRTSGTNAGGATLPAPTNPTPPAPPTPTPAPPPPPPPPITANAGTDRIVEDGESVLLTGVGADPAGGTLRYSWFQIAGPPVALTNADTPTATFVAPSVTTTLEFLFSVSTANASQSDTIRIDVRPAPFLFVLNQSGASLVSFRKPAALNGDVAPRTNLAGADARLGGVSDFVFDKRGSLLVANSDNNRLSGYFNGLSTTGNTSPDRFVSNPDARLDSPYALTYDRGADLLFVANFDSFPGSVNVYADASSPNFSGRIAPVRRILSNGIQNARAMHWSASGELYVGNGGNWTVSVFANAAALDGNVTPSGSIFCQELESLADIAIDQNDRLYTLDATARRVLVFASASTLNGEATPARRIAIGGALAPAALAVDAAGVGYVADSVNHAVYVIRDLATRDGTVTPDAVITGPNTGINGPARLVIVQR